MKTALWFLAPFLALAAQAADFEVVARAKCTDMSKVNNHGSVQVRVLADTYDENDADRGLTLVVDWGTGMMIGKHVGEAPAETRTSLAKGKPRRIQVEAGGANTTFTALVSVQPRGEKGYVAKLLRVEESSEWSDDEENMPANYDPTYICH